MLASKNSFQKRPSPSAGNREYVVQSGCQIIDVELSRVINEELYSSLNAMQSSSLITQSGLGVVKGGCMFIHSVTGSSTGIFVRFLIASSSSW